MGINLAKNKELNIKESETNKWSNFNKFKKWNKVVSIYKPEEVWVIMEEFYLDCLVWFYGYNKYINKSDLLLYQWRNKNKDNKNSSDILWTTWEVLEWWWSIFDIFDSLN